MSGKNEPVESSLDELYRRPGFLLRRAHQISAALFLEEATGLALTTTQYGALVVLRARGSLDQVDASSCDKYIIAHVKTVDVLARDGGVLQI